jgi:Fic family protein
MDRGFIWSEPQWPALRFDARHYATALSNARREQGKIIGMFRAIGFDHEADVAREIWTGEAIGTAAIEGEHLDMIVVRSSVARRLGVVENGHVRASRNVDGLLDVMQDAVDAYREDLDGERLHRWHSALFPGGTSGIRRINVGAYRNADEPMQIVSGPAGRERVHYEAPRSASVPREMDKFLAWWEGTRPDRPQRDALDGIVRAAISHLWFETLHPFEDGNGRIGRALIDMALAQDARSSQRLYSMSRQLMAVREEYYENLNKAQRDGLDISAWIAFFVNQFVAACVTSQSVIDTAIEKNRFWVAHAQDALNDRQRKVLRRLLDAGKGGFSGGLSAEKYANLTGSSKATATRDLTDLARRGLLVVTGQGRGTRYRINLPGWPSAS